MYQADFRAIKIQKPKSKFIIYMSWNKLHFMDTLVTSCTALPHMWPIVVQVVNQYPSALLALNQLRRCFWLRHVTTSRIPTPWQASPHCITESLWGFLQKTIYWLASCWQTGWKQAAWQIIDGQINAEDSRFGTDTSTRQGQMVWKLSRHMESKLWLALHGIATVTEGLEQQQTNRVFWWATS